MPKKEIPIVNSAPQKLDALAEQAAKLLFEALRQKQAKSKS